MSNNVVAGSLLYNTLVSSDFKVDEALTNRVKGLEQNERVELINDLDKILKATSDHPGQSVEPLTERGVAVLLKTDGGTHQRSSNIIERLWRTCCNLFGDRISSESIINRIVEIRYRSGGQPGVELSHQSIKDRLVAAHNELQNTYSEQVGGRINRMKDLKSLKDSCWDCLKYISDKMKLTDFGTPSLEDLDAEVNIILIAAKQNNLADEFSDPLKALGRTNTCLKKISKHANATAISQEDAQSIIDMLRYEAQEGYLTKDQIENLQSRVANPDRALMQELIRLVHFSTLYKSVKLFRDLESAYNTEKSEINKLQNDSKLLRKRHQLLTENEDSVARNKAVVFAENDLGLINNEISSISFFIDTAKSLSQYVAGNSSDRNFLKFFSFIDLNSSGDDEIQNLFVLEVKILCDILSGRTTAYSEDMLEAIDDHLSPAESDNGLTRDLKARVLAGLKNLPNLNDEASKKAYAENYFLFLKIVLEARLQSCKEERNRLLKVIKQPTAQRTQALSSAPLLPLRAVSAAPDDRETVLVPNPQVDVFEGLLQALASPGPSLPADVAVGNVLEDLFPNFGLQVPPLRADLPVVNILENLPPGDLPPQLPLQQQQLLSSAHYLFMNAGDPDVLKGARSLVESSGALTSDVHQNFFFIMSNRGRVQNENRYWAGSAFVGIEPGKFIEGNDDSAVNIYRAQAMYWASKGIKFTDVNDPRIRQSIL